MKFFLFDTETDSLIGSRKIRQEKWPRVIEFTGMLYEEVEKIDELDTLVNPHRKVSQEITDITGITNDMLVGQPELKDIEPKIRELIEGANFVVAHNLSFDKTVLDLEFERLSLKPLRWPALLCTVQESEHYLMRRLKLGELHEFLFNESFAGAHRARQDVEAMVRCFFEIKRRNDV